MTIKEIQLLFIIVADTPVPLVIDVPSLLLYEGQESLLSVVVSCFFFGKSNLHLSLTDFEAI